MRQRLRISKVRLASARIPSATYRLQFQPGFGFSDATAILPYLNELGISDVYASPVFNAGAGSTHGYDVCSYELSPALGGPREFERFAQALQENNMGLLLDIVPNHMRADVSNPWWHDVLCKGEKSQYARLFDIDWQSRQCPGKVLLPVLEDEYWKVVKAGKLRLVSKFGRRWISYYDHLFPLSPQISNPDSLDIHQLLEAQNYRLASWKAGPDQINYRRFFEISELVCLNAQLPEVFERSHWLIRQLVQRGTVTGLRIDHPDGLWDPAAYLERLQKLRIRSPKQTARPRFYVVVEKILSRHESLPREWAANGTTGYDFLNQVNSLFVEARHAAKMNSLYEAFTGSKTDWGRILFESRRQLLLNSFPGQFRALLETLKNIGASTRYGRDLTHAQLKASLVGLICAFPVYRTYINERSTRLSPQDRHAVHLAVRYCRSLLPAAEHSAVSFIRSLLLLKKPHDLNPKHIAQNRLFVMRLQQLTAPLAAKGLEDTACYVFNRLISLNEVGGNPECFGTGVAEFHRFNRHHSTHWPNSLLATATHDTKRGEDTRARINVLSEVPELWGQAVMRWRSWNADKKIAFKQSSAPDANDEYLLYQTLIGSWPYSLKVTNVDLYRNRITDYMIKAVRESKRHTSWTTQDVTYERATRHFVQAILTPKPENCFLSDFVEFQRRVAYWGIFNSLAQLLIKCIAPGVPDFYQGTELWDFSLVDPDNRRVVDFALRREMLKKIRTQVERGSLTRACGELLKSHETGAIKLFVTWRSLQLRRALSAVFQKGAYLPVRVGGSHADHVVAFIRRHRSDHVVTVAPRLSYTLCNARGTSAPIGAQTWADTFLWWPGAQAGRIYTDQFTGREIKTQLIGNRVGLYAAAALEVFPLALLHCSGED